jgi:glycosyltransferase involved in cell wall biosynthesis
MDKKISVTIPVYNVKPVFIQEAINSVLNQTYSNIEIIVVNDGSTDENTLEYLKTINNPKIKIINQENKGLGGARNTGIENSTGEYIGFLDADDWLDSNYYEFLYNLCEENKADIACASLTRTDGKHQKADEYLANVVVSDFVQKLKYISNGSVCSKIFKKELFTGIRFSEKVYAEDNPVLIQLLLKSEKVAFTKKVKYYYRENFESICLNPQNKQKVKADKLFILKSISEIIKQLPQEYIDAVWRVFAGIIINAESYNSEPEYRIQVNELLGDNYEEYISSTSRNTFIENIFSIKNSAVKTHKIITILWIKFKIKKVMKNG